MIRNGVSEEKISEQTKARIIDLCKIILVNDDELNIQEAEEYINEHIDNNVKLETDNYNIKLIVQNEITQYIENCPSNVQLFAFASDNNFYRYRNDFKEYYNEHYYSLNKRFSALVYPTEFEYIFDYIQEAIDFHTLFEKFAIKMTDQTVKRTKNEVTEVMNNTIRATEETLRKAQKAAESAASQSVDKVMKELEENHKIEQFIETNVEKEINKEIVKIPQETTKTSVTLLGMFSGIVLTIVAGLFYSSSVISNVNSANFYRLIATAALVGFICYNLLTLMFCYIERIRRDSPKQSDLNKAMIFVNVSLLIIMVIFSVLQFFVSDNTISERENITTYQTSTEALED